MRWEARWWYHPNISPRRSIGPQQDGVLQPDRFRYPVSHGGDEGRILHRISGYPGDDTRRSCGGEDTGRREGGWRASNHQDGGDREQGRFSDLHQTRRDDDDDDEDEGARDEDERFDLDEALQGEGEEGSFLSPSPLDPISEGQRVGRKELCLITISVPHERRRICGREKKDDWQQCDGGWRGVPIPLSASDRSTSSG